MNDVIKIEGRAGVLMPYSLPKQLGRLSAWMERANAWPSDIPKDAPTIAALRRARTTLTAKLAPPPVPETAALLTRLSTHYWRPDLAPSQVRAMIEDYVEDLRDVPLDILAECCRRWRIDARNKFFPRPGELLALARPLVGDRKRELKGVERALALTEGGSK